MDEVRWLIGMGISIALAVVGWLILAHNRRLDKQDKAHEAMQTKHAIDIKDVHARLDMVQAKHSTETKDIHTRIDTVHKDYVRRDDFREFKDDVKESLARIEEKQDKLINLSRPH